MFKIKVLGWVVGVGEMGENGQKCPDAPNSSKSLPNCPKMSQIVQLRCIVVRTDLFPYSWSHVLLANLRESSETMLLPLGYY